MKRRIISFLLALAMMVSLLPTGVFSIQSFAAEGETTTDAPNSGDPAGESAALFHAAYYGKNENSYQDWNMPVGENLQARVEWDWNNLYVYLVDTSVTQTEEAPTATVAGKSFALNFSGRTTIPWDDILDGGIKASHAQTPSITFSLGNFQGYLALDTFDAAWGLGNDYYRFNDGSKATDENGITEKNGHASSARQSYSAGNYLTADADKDLVIAFGLDIVELKNGGVSLAKRDLANGYNIWIKDSLTDGKNNVCFTIGFYETSEGRFFIHRYVDETGAAASESKDITALGNQLFVRAEFDYDAGEDGVLDATDPVAAKYYINGVLVAAADNAMAATGTSLPTTGIKIIDSVVTNRGELWVNHLSVAHKNNAILANRLVCEAEGHDSTCAKPKCTRCGKMVVIEHNFVDGVCTACNNVVEYTIRNNEVTITGYSGAVTDLVIPATIEGLPVTTIGYQAFSNCDSLTSVTIGNSVTTIGDSAFEYCDSLTSVTMGNSVTTIGSYAFRDCDSLTSVTIGNGVTTIGSYAFCDCPSLTSVTMGNSVTTIGSYAFYNCSSLTSITIPDGVTTIGRYAFYSCDSLTGIWVDANNPNYSSDDKGVLLNKDKTALILVPGAITEYTIPDSVTTIGSYAFHDCDSLTGITIPDSVITIGSDAFSGCASLTSVTIGNSVTTIGDSAFYNCDSLTSVTMGNSVTTIGDWAFEDCDSLTSIIIPDSVTSICESAFGYCNSLTSVTIGNGVTYIGEYAFYYCDSLTSIIIPDSVTTIEYYAFRNCSSLTSIIIPDSVTTIGISAFEDCDSLTSVTIGNGVTTIDSYAFYNCSSLTTVYYGGTEAQRDAIKIYWDNENLLSATWHYKEAATTITAQPEDAEVALDKYAEFSVAVSGDNVTYQWQYKAANSEKWLNSTAQDATTAALRVQMKAYRAGQQYRCIITTADGEQLISEAATMTVKSGEIVINSQPVSVGNAVLGKTSQFTVDAATLGGEDISYQWYVYNASKGEWERSYLEGYNTATLTVSVTRFRVGLQYKCVITSGLNEVETDVVTLNMQQIVMEEQNAQFADKIGGNAVLSVNAAGNGLQYQWYFSNDGETWKVSGLTGNKTNELTVKTLAYRVGQIYRCKITDVNGQVTWSEAVTLTVG